MSYDLYSAYFRDGLNLGVCFGVITILVLEIGIVLLWRFLVRIGKL